MPAAISILATTLADSDEFGWLKLLPFAIGLVIWIVGAIASKAQKQERERRQRAMAETWQPAPHRAPPPAYVAPPTAPFPNRSTPYPKAPPRRQVPPPPVPRTRRRKPSRPPQQPPQLPTEDAPVATPLVAQQPSPRAGRGAAPSSAPPALDARTLARWLRPEVMRRQFILTEVFDPPPALRQDEQGPR